MHFAGEADTMNQTEHTAMKGVKTHANRNGRAAALAGSDHHQRRSGDRSAAHGAGVSGTDRCGLAVPGGRGGGGRAALGRSVLRHRQQRRGRRGLRPNAPRGWGEGTGVFGGKTGENDPRFQSQRTAPQRLRRPAGGLRSGGRGSASVHLRRPCGHRCPLWHRPGA